VAAIGPQNNTSECMQVCDILCPPILENQLHVASKDRFIVDGTVGAGGHSFSLLKADPMVKMLCIDRDGEVLQHARRALSQFSDRVTYIHGSYADLPLHIKSAGEFAISLSWLVAGGSRTPSCYRVSCRWRRWYLT
jgi:hypothetical protein